MIVKLCDATDLPVDSAMKTFKDGRREICVARLQGQLYAMDNRCPHQGAPLSQGHLEGNQVVCPYHAWRFDIVTGEPEIAGDPPLITYEVRQYADTVFVRLPGC